VSRLGHRSASVSAQLLPHMRGSFERCDILPSEKSQANPSPHQALEPRRRARARLARTGMRARSDHVPQFGSPHAPLPTAEDRARDHSSRTRTHGDRASSLLGRSRRISADHSRLRSWRIAHCLSDPECRPSKSCFHRHGSI